MKRKLGIHAKDISLYINYVFCSGWIRTLVAMATYKRIGYNLNEMLESACLVINPIKVDGYAALFNCTPVDRPSDSLMAPTYSFSFKLVWTGTFVCCLVHRGSTYYLLLFQMFSGVV